jgi:hypothetical protein
MSDLVIAGLVLGVGVAHAWFYLHAFGRIEERSEWISTGIRSGSPLSILHREFLVTNSWLLLLGFTVCVQVICSVGYLVLGRSASDEEVKLYAYLVSAFSLFGGVGLLLLAPIWYWRLRSILQAELD